ncbi:MAG: SCO family protein [Flavobacteriaceae bacterium]|nr:SCO family protein [Flavobacteriaceae bacterium]
MKNYSYVGISFIILLFGIWAVPKIVDRMSGGHEMATIGKVADFNFTSHRGATIDNNSYKGKVYIAEFFFTTCPSICPIMNQNMVKVQNEFYGNPNLGIASFSIDPEYDTPEVLREYAESYGITNPNWHLLTGDKDAIFKLANEGFNLYVGEGTEEMGGFEHSGYFALIDQEGNIRSRFDENNNPIIYYDGLEAEGIQMLIEDIKQLLQ